MPEDVFEPETPENDGEENFAELFESYMKDQPDLRVGDRISGEVIAVGDQNLFINTGTKTDGVAEKSEFLNDDGTLDIVKGDRLDLYVIAIGDGDIRLSKSISGAGGDRLLQDAFQSRIPVEGRVTEKCKGGFRVNIMKKSAFCPISQMDTRYIENEDEYVGQSFNFLITRFEQRGRNIVVSRRELLEQEQEAAKKEFFENAAVDDMISGKVTAMKPYGVFVEIVPGVEGMVHISELAWSRVGHPGEIFSIGDPLTAKIIDIKKETRKIALSVRQATADPWETVLQKFKPGDKTDGKVTRCADFGAFVEIAPGIEGLVHISEMSYVKRVMRAEDVVSPGDRVAVTVKDIDPENKRISLSLKDAEGDPWLNIRQKYQPGQVVTGRIEKKESFGYFIFLEPGITGLLPKSKINSAPNAAEIEKLKTDDAISVKVDAIDSEQRKITLAAEGDADDWKKFAPPSKPSASGAMGDLGAKLQSALKKKNQK